MASLRKRNPSFFLARCQSNLYVTCLFPSSFFACPKNEARRRQSGYGASATKKGSSDESDTTIGVVRPASINSKIYGEPSQRDPNRFLD